MEVLDKDQSLIFDKRTILQSEVSIYMWPANTEHTLLVSEWTSPRLRSGL